jgi:hypothetical protein
VVNEITPELGDISRSLDDLKGVVVSLTAHGVSQERSDRAYRSMTSLARAQARKLRLVYLKPVARVGRCTETTRRCFGRCTCRRAAGTNG